MVLPLRNFGNSEEYTIEYKIYCRPTVGRQLADRLPTGYRQPNMGAIVHYCQIFHLLYYLGILEWLQHLVIKFPLLSVSGSSLESNRSFFSNYNILESWNNFLEFDTDWAIEADRLLKV